MDEIKENSKNTIDLFKQNNIKTPINDRIVEIIKKEQAKELPLETKNIDLFDDLI